MKWADYCISKLSFAENEKTISEVFVHVDNGDTIEKGEIRNRNWLVQQTNNKKTFCCITNSVEGKFKKVCDFNFGIVNFR